MLKQLFKEFLGLFGITKNLSSITASVVKVHQELSEFADEKYEEAVVKTMAAQKLNESAAAAESEADEAKLLASNFANLIPQDQLNG